MQNIKHGVLYLVILIISGCAFGPTKSSYDYSAYVASDPRSVLIVAEQAIVGKYEGYAQTRMYFLASTAQLLASRGYYVVPVRLSEKLARQQGFIYEFHDPFIEYDLKQQAAKDAKAKLLLQKYQQRAFIDRRAAELTDVFGVDSILYIKVQKWDREILGKSLVDPTESYNVSLQYQLTDHRGETLWQSQQEMYLKRGGGDELKQTWNLFAAPLPHVIKRRLAYQATREVITGIKGNYGNRSNSDISPMLVGPYHADYERDRAKRRTAARKP